MRPQTYIPTPCDSSKSVLLRDLEDVRTKLERRDEHLLAAIDTFRRLLRTHANEKEKTSLKRAA
jgi:hypothetical protein